MGEGAGGGVAAGGGGVGEGVGRGGLRGGAGTEGDWGLPMATPTPSPVTVLGRPPVTAELDDLKWGPLHILPPP